MATKCYAMVRGSAIRVTGLGSRGQIPDLIPHAVSKSVASVTINEAYESSTDELLRTEEDEPRLRFKKSSETIRYYVDIDFLRVDPGVLSLVSGVPLVRGHQAEFGFGEGPFGEFLFGGGSDIADGTVVGFDSGTRRLPVAFALEVWSRLAGQSCGDGTVIPRGPREWGYTVFPYLRGGYLSGFAFDNGLVSFNLRNAQTRRVPRWGVGPYDLEGSHRRLIESLGRNVSFRSMLTTASPPTQTDGIVEFEDVIHGGSASMTTSDVIEGGSASVTSPWIVEGGRAV